MALNLKKIKIKKFGWNWPSGSGEEDENVKSLQTGRQTDDGRQVIRKAHLSLGELLKRTLKILWNKIKMNCFIEFALQWEAIY